MKNFIKLILSILVCNAAGFIGSFFTMNSVQTWYQTINRPIYTPPGWIFGPVWIILYILMGVSLYLVIKNYKKDKLYQVAIVLFSIQLILNTLWSIIFFGNQNILGGLIEITILLCFIILTTIYFYKINKVAAYLLLPYIAWVSFATFLNFSFFILN